MIRETYADDFRVLINALRAEAFRFVLITHNHFQVFRDVEAQLREQLPGRSLKSLRLRGKSYREINAAILAAAGEIVLIPDFDNLFHPDRAAVRVAFNQRRDLYAQRKVALVCFIGPGGHRQLPKLLPDFWSLRSLELDFEYHPPVETRMQSAPATPSVVSTVELDAEIENLEQQLAETEIAEVELGLYVELAKKLQQRSRYATAEETARAGLKLALEFDDQEKVADFYYRLGSNAYNRGAYEQALERLVTALRIYRELEQRAGIGNALNDIGLVYDAQGKYDSALKHHEQSLVISREIGDRSGEGVTLNNMASISRARGDYATALTYLEQSLVIRREIGDRSGEGTTLNNISQIYDARGDYATALRYLEQSLVIQREIGDRSGEGATLNNLSQIYDARGDSAITLTYLEQSLVIQREIGDRSGSCATLHNMAQIAREQDQEALYLEYESEAYHIAVAINYAAGIYHAGLDLGSFLCGAGQVEEGLPMLQKSYEVALQGALPGAEEVLALIEKYSTENA